MVQLFIDCYSIRIAYLTKVLCRQCLSVMILFTESYYSNTHLCEDTWSLSMIAEDFEHPVCTEAQHLFFFFQIFKFRALTLGSGAYN